MKTLSLDLRERILAAYDAKDSTREMVAARFRVSLGMVKKLLQQRRHLGEIGAQHHRAGRKPRILPAHREQLRRQLAAKPDLTLAELRTATGLACTLPAIHYVLADMGLTFKKRLSGQPNRTARTLSGRAAGGAHLVDQLLVARPRPGQAGFPRRVGGEDKHDPPAGPRAPRPALAGQGTARPLAYYDHDQLRPARWEHRLHDHRRGH